VYGRTKTTARIEQGRKRVVRTTRARSEDWTVLLIDHHAGYIGWEDWQRNQAVIANNANAMADVVQGSVRRGAALLSGLLRCGHCGAKLVAQYPSPGVIRYQCNGRILDPDLPCCVMFGGLRADRMVAEQALQCLSPQAIQAAVQALGALRSAGDERIEQKRLALEHARYEASRARRQYDAVDPDNRLVAAELERRWNEALRAQTHLEEELAALQRQRPQPIDVATQREILALAEDLPRLWDHPKSLPEFKKRILRTVLKEIIVRSEGDTVHFVLHWQGGDHTELRMQKARTGQHRYVNDADTIALIRALARLQPDSMIASILNRMGRRTPHGQGWTAARVGATRGNHSIPVYRQGEGQARGELTVAETAASIGVTPNTVLRLIRGKRLPATQVCANAPWILRKDDVERFLAARDPANPPQTLDPNQLALDIQ
jgi:excisionase family DNA binding protein